VNFVGASHQIVYILVLYYYSKSKVSVSTLPLAMWSYSGYVALSDEPEFWTALWSL